MGGGVIGFFLPFLELSASNFAYVIYILLLLPFFIFLVFFWHSFAKSSMLTPFFWNQHHIQKASHVTGGALNSSRWTRRDATLFPDSRPQIPQMQQKLLSFAGFSGFRGTEKCKSEKQVNPPRKKYLSPPPGGRGIKLLADPTVFSSQLVGCGLLGRRYMLAPKKLEIRNVRPKTV